MSESEESSVVSLSTRQWAVLAEHLDSQILNEFLVNELPFIRSNKAEGSHREETRKLQVDQLKRLVSNDSNKLSLLTAEISSRQPELAKRMNLVCAGMDSSPQSSRKQGNYLAMFSVIL